MLLGVAGADLTLIHARLTRHIGSAQIDRAMRLRIGAQARGDRQDLIGIRAKSLPISIHRARARSCVARVESPVGRTRFNRGERCEIQRYRQRPSR